MPGSHHNMEKMIRSTKKPILLMSHLVLGYPGIEENRQVIAEMVAGGVDLMELQIPFSEPIADGPMIAKANQDALDNGFKVRAGLDFVAEAVKAHKIPFLIMTYYNILMAYGVEEFIKEAARIGVKGLIIPDLPPQEATEAIAFCQKYGQGELDWIQLMTPTSSDARLAEIGKNASGFVYCVARKGVTGKKTDFGDDLAKFIKRCRAATNLPLAVGFGVKSAADVSQLSELAEIAVVGTAAIKIHEEQGAKAVGEFFKGLR
ncbi:MAG: tryptophan synthase subunit alpha [Magnetococcales bacterium]|nr:tryptophan synthase subunit alpha [Magnetococcales bacterium]